MGEVYRATDTRLNRPVALTFLLRALDGDEVRDRFRREVRGVGSRLSSLSGCSLQLPASFDTRRRACGRLAPAHRHRDRVICAGVIDGGNTVLSCAT
jgi:hypothetical protein